MSTPNPNDLPDEITQNQPSENNEDGNSGNDNNEDNSDNDGGMGSLFDQRKESGTDSKYVSDEVYLIQDIGQEAGLLSEAHATSHPLGIFRANVFGSPLAQEIRDKAIAGAPQELECLPSGKLQTPDGNVVARMLDYRDNPVDPNRENDGNIRLVTNGRNGMELTSSRSNSHGLNIQGHFEDAYAEGNRQALAAILRYIKFAMRDGVTVPDAVMEGDFGDADLNFEAHSDKAKVLKRRLIGAGRTEKQSTQKPAIEGIA